MIPVTVNEHEAFRAELGTHEATAKAGKSAWISAHLVEEIAIDPGDFNPPARRKDSEIKRVLEIIDNLTSGVKPA